MQRAKVIVPYRYHPQQHRTAFICYAIRSIRTVSTQRFPCQHHPCKCTTQSCVSIRNILRFRIPYSTQRFGAIRHRQRRQTFLAAQHRRSIARSRAPRVLQCSRSSRIRCHRRTEGCVENKRRCDENSPTNCIASVSTHRAMTNTLRFAAQSASRPRRIAGCLRSCISLR